MPRDFQGHSGRFSSRLVTERVTGLVLAAGGSRRLGRPKQLLPYCDGTLLGAVLNTARSCGFDQLLVALGGASAEVRDQVDLSGCIAVENPAYGSGCSSSIAAAVPLVALESEVLVLLLGDQPGVTADTVRLLLQGQGDAPMAVCRYQDGVGHPFAFRREMLPVLGGLHGDKAVWKLLSELSERVAEVAVPSAVPHDVNTEEDYQQLLNSAAGR
jgi:molybdenum cofactor cytidylyltransferase